MTELLKYFESRATQHYYFPAVLSDCVCVSHLRPSVCLTVTVWFTRTWWWLCEKERKTVSFFLNLINGKKTRGEVKKRKWGGLWRKRRKGRGAKPEKEDETCKKRVTWRSATAKRKWRKRGNIKEEILLDCCNMTWFIKRKETQKKQNEKLKME